MNVNARWRGLKDLVQDAVEHGSRAVERVQREAARRPFALLARIPPIEAPVRGVHEVYDLSVATVHGAIRGVNRAVGGAFDVVFDALEPEAQSGRPRAWRDWYRRASRS